MKHVFRCLCALSLIVLCSVQSVWAQQIPQLPVDQNVRMGKLSNGLTYYIRKNAVPEKRADFYIAQKVGSIQEEESQRGLAHFLEHMCFNGTTHFPGDALKQYLEHIGVKFGENLNAYTSIDETVYNISNVPVTIEGAIDSCLLILHDWSNDLLLEPKEIDKERGVINEEWRTRMSAMQRMQEKMLPQMYAGTKYENCFPIGTMDVVMNFKYQTLRDYYEKWYRPDLQGIMVVGDINVDEVEQKIKSLFADIPAQPNAAERVYYPVADNKEPIIIIERDKEQPLVQAMVFFKHEAVPTVEKSNMTYLIDRYARVLIGNMLSNRMNELTQSANPPYIYAGGYDADFFVSKTKGAFTGVVACKENDIKTGLETMLREIIRAKRFGFTESEYVRARAEFLRHAESAFNEREKRQNEQLVNEYVRHFLDNEPIPGVEFEYAFYTKMLPNIPVQGINQMMNALVADDNQVLALLAPEKEGLVLPSKEELLQILTSVQKEELTPYVDKVSNEPLMKEKPKNGKIVSEKQNEAFGTTELTLANGVKVVIKETDFKADEIHMKGVSMGGSSLFPNEEFVNINALDVVAEGGLGNFSNIELQKMLAGKKASVEYGIGDKTEAVGGKCSPKDLETMLQLTYLTFTAPRRDETAFASYKSRTKASLQNQAMNPAVAFSDSINKAIYKGHIRSSRITKDLVDKIDYDKVMEMYTDRFKDASDFTFIFVGNVNAEKDKQLIADYLGNLPAINRKETFRDNKMDVRKGNYKNEFIKQQETPKTSVFVLFSGKCKYDLRNKVTMDIASQILSIIYTETVREEEGGTYGVYVGGSLRKYTHEEAIMQIIFDTAPEKKEKLMEIIFDQANKLAKNEPSEENMKKVKEFMLKKHKENLKENGYWLAVLDAYFYSGVDELTGYEEMVNSITAKDIQKFMKKLLKQKNQIEVSMVSPAK